MRTRLTRVALAAVLLLACRTASRGPAFTPVSDADYGRLAPDQTGPLDQARADLAAASDAAARARLRLQDAQSEEGHARADQTEAQADAQRAAVESRAARESNDQVALGRAAEEAEAAKLRQASADAHLAYARKLGAARQATVAAADARVKLAQAEVERAKLQALQQAEVPAATKYDAARFDAEVERARQAYEQARQDASRAEQEAVQAQNQWQALQQRWQARTEGVGGPG